MGKFENEKIVLARTAEQIEEFKKELQEDTNMEITPEIGNKRISEIYSKNQLVLPPGGPWTETFEEYILELLKHIKDMRPDIFEGKNNLAIQSFKLVVLEREK